MKHVAFDCETTGLDPGTDRIIQMAMVLIEGRTMTATWEHLVHPGDEALSAMSEEASKVHGLDATALDGAPEFTEAWSAALKWLDEHAQGATFIAHNAAFDRGMLDAELARGDTDGGNATQHEWTDTWQRSREEFGDEGGSHSLDGLARRVGITTRAKTAAHDALGDARLLAQCWIAWHAPKTADLFEDTNEERANTRTTPMASIVTFPEHPDALDAWRAYWERPPWRSDPKTPSTNERAAS